MIFAAVALFPATAQAQAIQAWVQRYDGPANGGDFAGAIAVGANGNVYVTGYSDGGASADDFVTVAYSSAGVAMWTNRYGGADYDSARAVAVDSRGDVFVTGHWVDANGSSHCTTIKYSSVGVPLWTNFYSASASSGGALAIDASGSVIVAGDLNGACLTLKYSGAGELLWSRQTSALGASALTVDGNGDVVLTGTCFSSVEFNDYATLKYSSAGVQLWFRQYRGSSMGDDQAKAVAVDASCNVYVTGLSSSGHDNFDYATLKYSSAGVPLWTNRYDNGDDGATALVVDAGGDICVAGNSAGGCATLKYSSAGLPLWTNYYKGTRGGGGATALAMDKCGNIYATGWESGGNWSPDYVTIAYSSAGVPLWTNRYNGPGNEWDEPKATVVDASGSVYVTGWSIGTGSRADFATIKYVIPPIITRQPMSCTNAVGSAASFNVEAVGGTPLSYQWRREGTNLVGGVRLSGATTTNLSIANVQLEDACDYTVVVTNEWGSATSVAAHLTVTIPPSAGRLTNLKYSGETGFSFIFRDATVGQPYRIQRSPSMAEGSWLDWQSFTYTEPILFTDLGAAGQARRFYRAINP